jgi:hypothetical protein
MNEPIDFVRNAMVRNDRIACHPPWLMRPQREGTAVSSLASEHLQRAETLSGTERQNAERTIKETLASLFQGASYSQQRNEANVKHSWF